MQNICGQRSNVGCEGERWMELAQNRIQWWI